MYLRLMARFGLLGGQVPLEVSYLVVANSEVEEERIREQPVVKLVVIVTLLGVKPLEEIHLQKLLLL